MIRHPLLETALACPFCGSTDVGFARNVAIRCHSCGAEGGFPREKNQRNTQSISSALAAWNRRCEVCGYLIRDGQTTIGACERRRGHDGEHQRVWSVKRAPYDAARAAVEKLDNSAHLRTIDNKST